MNNWFDQEVVEILDKSYSSHIFPGYEQIDFPFATIKTIIDRNSQDKKRAIESIKGIYMLSDTKNGKHYIIVDEVPYGVNTSELKNKVAELVHNKTIEGIADYHTDLKEGIKITITLKKDANAQVVLNKLFKHTQFQTNYGISFLMLDNGVPKTLGLKEIIEKYINYQKEIIVRRTKFDLDKAEKQVHILEGLKIALDNIDAVIKTIKESKSDDVAKEALMKRFGLTLIQSEAILEMKLRRLTGLERDKIEADLNELHKLIAELKSILESEAKVLQIIKDELTEIKNKYGDERKTSIDMTAIDYIEDESLIPEENIIVTVTKNGYIKRCTSDTYKIQNRGGVGVKGMSTNDEDFVEYLLNLSTHDYIMIFTNKGKVYRLKGYEIPEFSRQSKGLPIVNVLPVEKDEKISNIIKLNVENKEKYLILATKQGLIKRTNLEEFENIRATGKICIKLKENDELIGVKKTNGESNILLASSEGRMNVFDENEIRVMGRTASGVKGINLGSAKCVSIENVNDDDNIVIVTENGYGKKTLISEYRKTKRGSKGVKALNITEKNGNIASIKKVIDDSDIMIITNQGIIIRLPLEQVSQLGRVTQGTRLINLKSGQKVSSVSLVQKEKEPEEEIIEKNE